MSTALFALFNEFQNVERKMSTAETPKFLGNRLPTTPRQITHHVTKARLSYVVKLCFEKVGKLEDDIFSFRNFKFNIELFGQMEILVRVIELFTVQDDRISL
jgi:hypothetical protein